MASEEAKVADLGARVVNLEKSQLTMAGDIKEIKDNLLLRPSWAVSIIITILVSICTGLTIYVATSIK